MNTHAEKLCWFGKLPCVGDFCSHNMPAGLLETLDLWLSSTIQEGQAVHGSAWTNAYFQMPVHGFVWGSRVTPEFHNNAAIGVLMPSVDKAGRAFPFVLLQQLPSCSLEKLAFESIALWFQQAHTLCADALNEDWCLNKFELKSESLALCMDESASKDSIQVGDAQSHWFEIDYGGAIKAVLQCDGLPASHDFNTLLGLGTAP